ncbi:MAG TPA: glutamate-5-semialdehyde dehydrogenase [Treponema sp.]|nr:glutamate-5-semialdehyde dehydrogenase [Treponema sp.]
MNLDAVCSRLRAASERLALCTAAQKNRALLGVGTALDAARDEILAANARDVQRARAGGMNESMIARLELTNSGIDAILTAIGELVSQTDPIGEVISGWSVSNGMQIKQVRVPLGVAAVIYESRPNVTVDAFALAYKSSNAVLLRGSSSALDSNRAIVSAIKSGLSASGGESEAVALSEPSSQGDRYGDVDWILKAVGKIDVALPRGGAALIKRVVETAQVPVIETGSGVCHIYVDESANLAMAVSIAENSKIQKPAACNSLECLLVHADRAADVLPALKTVFEKYEEKTGKPGGVEIRCDERALAILGKAPNVLAATDDDWGYEYLDYIMCVRVVDSLDEAIDYINQHNTKHSDSIITESRTNARRFQQRIDSSCVYVNASLRFTDGGEFGMGAELGISTQKLHARGPMGLSALTTIKYYIDGEGHVRT